MDSCRMVPLAKGGVAVAWLDSREMAAGGHHGPDGAMGLRYVEVDSALAISRESLLDARVCECCTTGMAMTANGPLIVYRDRSNEEIRDIGFVRRTGSDLDDAGAACTPTAGRSTAAR